MVKNYIVATIGEWHIDMFHRMVKNLPGMWHLVASPDDLKVHFIREVEPRFIFFPHWRWKVPNEILSLTECICFHETALPYGRGGSPVQNLIALGRQETTITAFKMTEFMDSGPVYLRRPVSLLGGGDEVFMRVAQVVAGMICDIVVSESEPEPQGGAPSYFVRRRPEESSLPTEDVSLMEVFDHVRMLDAGDYPRAFLEVGELRLEFSRPVLRVGQIKADVTITMRTDD